MHIWIDIDNHKHVPLVKALVIELKERGHEVTVTAEDKYEIKQALQQSALSAKHIGSVFSVFGFFEKQLVIIRSVLLVNHLQKKKINIAFSLGSRPMAYTCNNTSTPIILFIQDYKQKVHWIHIALNNSFFMFSDNTPDSLILEHGYALEWIVKYQGNLQLESTTHEIKTIKSIANQIEHSSRKMNPSKA